MKNICYFEHSDVVNGRLVIPEGVDDIYSTSFCDSRSLIGPHSAMVVDELVISSTVSWIDPELFYSDRFIVKSITLSENNPFYHMVNGCLVKNDTMRIIWVPENCVIPDSIKRVSDIYGQHIKSIVIPESVVEIEQSAFENLYNLESLEINADIKGLHSGFARYCRSLKHIKLPDTITVFGGCLFTHSGLVSKPGIYKAFQLKDGELVCRGKRYGVGHKSRAFGKLKLCGNGIHFCTNLFSVFNYYYGEYGEDFVIAECEASKERVVSEEKSCARWLRPVRVLEREEVLRVLNGE